MTLGPVRRSGPQVGRAQTESESHECSESCGDGCIGKQVLEIEAVAARSQDSNMLFIKYARPGCARRMRARGCRWTILGESKDRLSRESSSSHQFAEGRSRNYVLAERLEQRHSWRRNGILCGRIRRNADYWVRDNQTPTIHDESDRRHACARSDSNERLLNSPHNGSCSREYDASHTRRRCATASSGESDIGKTRSQEYSGAIQTTQRTFGTTKPRPSSTSLNCTS